MKGKMFVQHLETLRQGRGWTRMRAVLRRSLAFPPGTYPPAFPWIEPLVTREGWAREALYLVAALYALNDGEHRPGRPFARAFREVVVRRGSESLEKRFLALLEADRDEIAYRLRHLVALVDEGLDYAQLLDDLLGWFHPQRYVQVRWAREYYGPSS